MTLGNGKNLSFGEQKFVTTENSKQHDAAPTPAERVWGRPALDEMRGFLTLRAPSVVRESFSPVDALLEEMPVIRKTKGGKHSSGLLGKNQFREHAKRLPDLSLEIEHNTGLLSDTATNSETKNTLAFNFAMLFRDYQYLKMGYLFEPVLHGKEQAEICLPQNIARPLHLLAQIFQRKPWLEYASGYVLANSDFGPKITPHDINLFRSWHGGADEFYFQTIHSVIEWETPQLFSALNSVFLNIHTSNAIGVRNAMANGISITQRMLATLKLMPKLSRPAYYSADVRPQIQGLVGNTGEGKLFEERGVFFEGCGNDRYEGKSGLWLNDIRGQTGAQSSIIPLLDSTLGITEFYGANDNPLSQMLLDFRDYRPTPHAELLVRVENTQKTLGARATLKHIAPLQLAHWCHTICQFREFHYYLAMAYIVKPGLKNQPVNQSRNIGTGGSPTPSYLPQNVKFTLQALQDALDAVETKHLSRSDQRLYEQLQQDARRLDNQNQQRSSVVGAYLSGQEPESQLDITLSEAKAEFFENPEGLDD
jgi:indoleamine 2,3-dioxygenase